MNLELCCQCHAPTGRAGRHDDSLYAGDYGPYCEDCWGDVPDMLAEQLATQQARINALTAEIEEQARLLGASGSREAELLARVEALEKEQSAWRKFTDEANRTLEAADKKIATQQARIKALEKEQSAWRKFTDEANRIVIGINEDALQEWIEYRKEKGRPLSGIALKKTQNIMLRYDEAQQQRMVDAAIMNDWQGLQVVLTGLPNSPLNDNYG